MLINTCMNFLIVFSTVLSSFYFILFCVSLPRALAKHCKLIDISDNKDGNSDNKDENSDNSSQPRSPASACKITCNDSPIDAPFESPIDAPFDCPNFSMILSPSFFSVGSFSSTHSSTGAKYDNASPAAVLPRYLADDFAACSLESKTSNESTTSSSSPPGCRPTVDLVRQDVNKHPAGIASLDTSGDDTPEVRTYAIVAKHVDDFVVETPTEKESVISQNFTNNLDTNVRKNYEKVNNFWDTAISNVSQDFKSNYVNIPITLENITEDCDENEVIYDDSNVTAFERIAATNMDEETSPTGNDSIQQNKVNNVIVEDSPTDGAGIVYSNVECYENTQLKYSVENSDLNPPEDDFNYKLLLENGNSETRGETGTSHAVLETEIGAECPIYDVPRSATPSNNSGGTPSESSRTSSLLRTTSSISNPSAASEVNDFCGTEETYSQIISNDDDIQILNFIDEDIAKEKEVDDAFSSISFPSPLTPPIFLDPGELGSPYENVLIPTVVDSKPPASGKCSTC